MKIINKIIIIILIFITVTACSKKEEYNIKLNGDTQVVHNVGTIYKDPGYEIAKNKNIEVKVENNVNYQELGEYSIIYKVYKDGENVENIVRTIKIVDSEAPNIVAKGTNIDINYGTKLEKTDDDNIKKMIDLTVTDNYDKEEDIKLILDYQTLDFNKEGTYVITITAEDSTGNKSEKQVKINIKKIPVDNLTLNKKNITLNVGVTEKLIATISPVDAYDKSVNWSSNDTSIVTVDQNGNIKGIKAGSTVVIVKTADGKYKTECNVTVKTVSVTGISLNNSNIKINVGQSSSLTANVLPSNATNKSIIWESSNTDIVTVSGGSIKGISQGTATITARTADGNYIAKCNVEVTKNAKEKFQDYLLTQGFVKSNSCLLKMTSGNYTTVQANICTNSFASTYMSVLLVYDYSAGKVTGVFTDSNYYSNEIYNVRTSQYICMTEPSTYYSEYCTSSQKDSFLYAAKALVNLFNGYTNNAGISINELLS